MNRLGEATHFDYLVAAWETGNRGFQEKIHEYDLNGNIIKLSRRRTSGSKRKENKMRINNFCSIWVATIIGSTNIICASGQIPLDLKREMFRLSILNKSTEPSYLVLTVFDKKRNLKKEIATTGNLLLWAIKKEYSLKGNDTKIEQIILNNTSLEFEFSNSEALANLNFDLYSESEFQSYKGSIAIDSIRDIINENPAINKKLRTKNENWAFDFTNEAGTFSDKKIQVMFAHVLFNNGIRTYQGDATGNTVFYHVID